MFWCGLGCFAVRWITRDLGVVCIMVAALMRLGGVFDLCVLWGYLPCLLTLLVRLV